MRQITTKAIILRRTNYGEADRIVSFLTPTLGKISALVKGVRKQRSKLAGGIELFSESTVTFMETRGNLGRIIQARLENHWNNLVGDLPRMMFGYEVMKSIDRVAPDDEGKEFYKLLKSSLTYLNSPDISLASTKMWFWLQILDIAGHRPDLEHDNNKKALNSSDLYDFSLADMVFFVSPSGKYRADHIKLLRLGLERTPIVLAHVKQFEQFGTELADLATNMAKYHLNLK
jgi:DNA repair protein RecO (recombination protein O)